MKNKGSWSLFFKILIILLVIAFCATVLYCLTTFTNVLYQKILQSSGMGTEKVVESQLLAIGLAIIALVVAVWSGLNIVNALDKKDIELARQRLGELDSHLENLDNSSKVFQEKTKSLEENLGSLDGRLGELNNSSKELQNRTQTVEEELKKASEELQSKTKDFENARLSTAKNAFLQQLSSHADSPGSHCFFSWFNSHGIETYSGEGNVPDFADFYNKLAVVEQNYNQIRLRHSSTDKKDPDLDSLIQTAKSTLGELLARLSSYDASDPCVTNTRWFLRYRDALCSFYSGYSHNSDDFDNAFCDFKKAAEEAEALLKEIKGYDNSCPLMENISKDRRFGLDANLKPAHNSSGCSIFNEENPEAQKDRERLKKSLINIIGESYSKMLHRITSVEYRMREKQLLSENKPAADPEQQKKEDQNTFYYLYLAKDAFGCENPFKDCIATRKYSIANRAVFYCTWATSLEENKNKEDKTEAFCRNLACAYERYGRLAGFSTYSAEALKYFKESFKISINQILPDAQTKYMFHAALQYYDRLIRHEIFGYPEAKNLFKDANIGRLVSEIRDNNETQTAASVEDVIGYIKLWIGKLDSAVSEVSRHVKDYIDLATIAIEDLPRQKLHYSAAAFGYIWVYLLLQACKDNTDVNCIYITDIFKEPDVQYLSKAREMHNTLTLLGVGEKDNQDYYYTVIGEQLKLLELNNNPQHS